MRKWMAGLRPLACGGVTLGVLQAVQGIDLNQIWFQFLAELWSWVIGVILMLVFGGDVSSLFDIQTGSQLGSFFV